MNLLHRSAATVVALACTMTASADTLVQIYCEDCRGPEHSRDYGNFALNQTYGTESWLLVDDLIIINPDGRWVYVDLNFELSENIISNLGDFIGIDLGIPTAKIQIDTTTDTTDTDSYIIDLDMIDTMGPLPVGEDDYGSGLDFVDGGGGDSSGGGSTSGGGVGVGGAGTGSTGGAGSGGLACTSAGGGEWHCVPY